MDAIKKLLMHPKVLTLAVEIAPAKEVNHDVYLHTMSIRTCEEERGFKQWFHSFATKAQFHTLPPETAEIYLDYSATALFKAID